jgi:hypothetical protein
MDKQMRPAGPVMAPLPPNGGAPGIDARVFTPGNRRRLSGPGLRAFLAIATQWGLTERERLLVLGLPSRSTYYGWVKAAQAEEGIVLPLDVLLRISAVLGIHKALRILFPAPNEALAWLRGPHAAPLFGGHPPLALITSGTQDGLLSVRRFLDAARGGLYMPPGISGAGSSFKDEDIVFV